jgi:hypothetical protein
MTKFYEIDTTKFQVGKYQPIDIHWRFCYIDIPNLETIKHELITLYNSDTPRKQFTPFYVNIYKQDIKNCPALFEYLNGLDLIHKFARVLFSKSDGIHINKALPHADSVDPKIGIKYSLNIPLVDAEDSCTVFYDKEINSNVYYSIETKTASAHTMDGLTEIERLYYTGPALLNTSIMHSGKAKSENRLIAGIRFIPELSYDEITKFGVKIN